VLVVTLLTLTLVKIDDDKTKFYDPLNLGSVAHICPIFINMLLEHVCKESIIQLINRFKDCFTRNYRNPMIDNRIGQASFAHQIKILAI
jgi:hypothetical protein